MYMSSFKSLPEFEKEKKKLAKKFRSLETDLTTFEKILRISPIGIGKNFTILHTDEHTQIVKARLACRSLRSRSLRIVYAYHQSKVTFMYIELYFKGNKESEERERIREYLDSVKEI